MVIHIDYSENYKNKQMTLEPETNLRKKTN